MWVNGIFLAIFPVVNCHCVSEAHSESLFCPLPLASDCFCDALVLAFIKNWRRCFNNVSTAWGHGGNKSCLPLLHHFTNAPVRLCHIQIAYPKWPIVLKALGGPFLSVVLPKKVDETFASTKRGLEGDSESHPQKNMHPWGHFFLFKWAHGTNHSKIIIPGYQDRKVPNKKSL